MQRFPLKKGWVILIAILLLLIFLNPSYNAFKEFTGLNGKDASALHKRINGLVFSVYENNDDNKKYVGVLMNFIDISHQSNNEIRINPADSDPPSPSVDTTVSYDEKTYNKDLNFFDVKERVYVLKEATWNEKQRDFVFSTQKKKATATLSIAKDSIILIKLDGERPLLCYYKWYKNERVNYDNGRYVISYSCKRIPDQKKYATQIMYDENDKVVGAQTACDNELTVFGMLNH